MSIWQPRIVVVFLLHSEIVSNVQHSAGTTVPRLGEFSCSWRWIMWTTDFCMSLVAVWCSPGTHFLSLFIWLFWLPDYPSLYPKPWASPHHKCTSSSPLPPPNFLPLHASSTYVTSLALSSLGQKGKVKPTGMKLGMESSSCRCFGCCLVAQLCLALYDTMHCSLPDSSVHGISQARILKWVAIFFSRRSSWSRDRTCISCKRKANSLLLSHQGSPATSA